jgi:hypothetical protein
MSSPVIKWNHVAGAQGFFVFRSEPLNTTAVTTLSYTDTTAVPGNTYIYEVRSVENGAISLVSHPVEVIT